MSGYRELSVAEKQRYQRDQVREPNVYCPECGAGMQPEDLIDHVHQRCEGPREPHPCSRWVTWRQAGSLGVSKATLSRWVKKGRVRARGPQGAREYLLRDLAKNLALRLSSGSIRGTDADRP